MFQLNAPFLYYIYHIPLHVSSNNVRAHHQEDSLYTYRIWFFFMSLHRRNNKHNNNQTTTKQQHIDNTSNHIPNKNCTALIRDMI